MKASANLFWAIAAFFAVATAVYVVWGLAYYDGGVEWVGAVALGLVALFAAFIAFYLSHTYGSQTGELPEDRLDANIDDGDPELGHFAPWSWWPFLLGLSAATVFFGLAIGIWICFIGVAAGLVCLVGWTYEYYRGYFAR